jgi:hypothetical protein
MFEIHDLDLSTARSIPQPQFKDSLVDFLLQFHDINSRWEGYISSFYGDFIMQCAQIQEDILSEASPTPENLSEDVLLIAISLRALALAHNLELVAYSLPCCTDTEMLSHTFLQPEIVRDENPSIEIWKCVSTPQMVSGQLEDNDGGQLPVIIQDIVRITQRMLFRRTPKDWPSLLCVLFLLKLICFQFYSSCNWLEFSNIKMEALENVWSLLCGLYSVCTKGHDPLTSDWNCEEYASLVGSDKLAVAHFTSLNKLWLDIGTTHHSCLTEILETLTEILKRKWKYTIMRIWRRKLIISFFKSAISERLGNTLV